MSTLGSKPRVSSTPAAVSSAVISAGTSIRSRTFISSRNETTLSRPANCRSSSGSFKKRRQRR